MPLHGWLPQAMVAPTPGALLHAVAVVNAGVFRLLRVIYSVYGHSPVGELKSVPCLSYRIHNNYRRHNRDKQDVLKNDSLFYN